MVKRFLILFWMYNVFQKNLYHLRYTGFKKIILKNVESVSETRSFEIYKVLQRIVPIKNVLDIWKKKWYHMKWFLERGEMFSWCNG